jgi:hypothetical protein
LIEEERRRKKKEVLVDDKNNATTTTTTITTTTQQPIININITITYFCLASLFLSTLSINQLSQQSINNEYFTSFKFRHQCPNSSGR